VWWWDTKTFSFIIFNWDLSDEISFGFKKKCTNNHTHTKKRRTISFVVMISFNFDCEEITKHIDFLFKERFRRNINSIRLHFIHKNTKKPLQFSNPFFFLI